MSGGLGPLHAGLLHAGAGSQRLGDLVVGAAEWLGRAGPSGLVQTSGQVGAALVLAVVTALVAGGAHSGGGGFGEFHAGV
ncbi:hypothetical protein, partial [Actinomadura rubrisoli]